MSNAQQEQITEAMPEEDSGPDGDTGLSAGAELAQMMIADPVALLGMLIDVLRLAKDNAQAPQGKFHTVVVPDVGVEATVTASDSFEEFLAVWREAWRQRVAQIFGFSPRGELILPAGGDRMVTKWGRFSLCIEGDADDVDPLGRLGPLPPIPRAIPKTTSTVADNGEDEVVTQGDEEVDYGVDDDEDGVDEDEDN